MQVCEYSQCTGCGVCADACPQKCIKIEYDKFGFMHAYVNDDLCVKCDRCKTVCPALNPNAENPIFKAYKVRRKDSQAITNSTSGGVATLVSEHIINSGGAVVGCAFDENLVLRHSLTSEISQLEGFKGSKYVQSNMTGIYTRIKKVLSENKMVLFIGTPCQVSALNNFLGQPYENLYTIDLLCHGVASQKILDKYIDKIEREIKGKIKLVKFRNKDSGYKNCSKNELLFLHEKGIHKVTHEKGIVLWFASSLSVRESCYKCNFVSTNRCSDLTIADYNGKDMNEEDALLGTSAVFVNSNKGLKLIEIISNDVFIEEKDLKLSIAQGRRLHEYTKAPPIRNKFFKDLTKLDIDKLIDKYTSKKILPKKITLYFIAAKKRLFKLIGR